MVLQLKAVGTNISRYSQWATFPDDIARMFKLHYLLPIFGNYFLLFQIMPLSMRWRLVSPIVTIRQCPPVSNWLSFSMGSLPDVISFKAFVKVYSYLKISCSISLSTNCLRSVHSVMPTLRTQQVRFSTRPCPCQGALFLKSVLLHNNNLTPPLCKLHVVSLICFLYAACFSHQRLGVIKVSARR